ncbi:MAG: hypothetical protein KatS3mg040_0117 [Candidatus Kapaibacterium sp.]|nr:MAG: hypothetical protein KatS3mg040_0117 [Candidatus Kapabacteria bacterium]
MLRSLLTALALSVFLLYSQSLLVMWCLYFVERHDIVLYFCPEELGSTNPFAGARYVHELSDAQHGKGEGALMLLQIVERAVFYLPSLGSMYHTESKRSILPMLEYCCGPSDGFPTTPFVPPRTDERAGSVSSS